VDAPIVGGASEVSTGPRPAGSNDPTGGVILKPGGGTEPGSRTSPEPTVPPGTTGPPPKGLPEGTADGPVMRPPAFPTSEGTARPPLPASPRETSVAARSPLARQAEESSFVEKPLARSAPLASLGGLPEGAAAQKAMKEVMKAASLPSSQALPAEVIAPRSAALAKAATAARPRDADALDLAPADPRSLLDPPAGFATQPLPTLDPSRIPPPQPAPRDARPPPTDDDEPGRRSLFDMAAIGESIAYAGRSLRRFAKGVTDPEDRKSLPGIWIAAAFVGAIVLLIAAIVAMAS
jgi:hypothetical protein